MRFFYQNEYWCSTITSIYFYPELFPLFGCAMSQIVQWILTEAKPKKNPNQTKHKKKIPKIEWGKKSQCLFPKYSEALRILSRIQKGATDLLQDTHY